MTQKLGKRELNRAKRRASIVEVAKDAFLEQGYAATSMSAIAEQLGGSKATMWSHFSSKEELFAAVVDEQVRRFGEDIEDVMSARRFSVPALRRLIERVLDRMSKPDSTRLYRLVIGEGERFPEITTTFWERGPAMMYQHITAFYATEFEPAESRRLTRLTMAAITGFRSQMLIAPPGELEQGITPFVETFMTYLRFPEPPSDAVAPTADQPSS
ncbi:hypothetical protein B2G71_10950 [Novosphingobium sp. PC22D]|uniref:TetR/AcrR family transcriptional regulator n=1 Tax=Novosphingobium sp. PC22D TaxID=1962403 RepID=UPI000BEFF9E8|nr:TetR/AcrR family transcriptional regulator [Novosphingobium sp. PC22D]PEQ12800.1 hypothetical protein B2G71_10950 [Novosphingobium sp. PC22D]